ncbi:MFS transporter [Pacificimonas flava]|uniref:L-Proline/Glycine betaine transporter ProP n=1 Tax=Pacificimonas flava TaxID=1234595 RepID=M2T947_9SPHN|nr:MFS transporter [Pacificimonas flava]EMD83054.1 L-Proline/Glycine betaine transporter ProP [Pacificimonas flava]MBB5280210.1 MFS family permease [Pacificimonas flava]
MAAEVAMEPVGAHRQRDRLVITASALGTVFEWYDFFVYGTLAALLGRLFFQVDSPTLGFLLSLLTFAAGFLVRPLGALIFGYLGDRIGRKYTFLITITLMGLATAAVGVMPTYAAIGLWAPLVLILLRLVQGLALGGEYGGAAIYVAEHAPTERRGFYTGFIQVSVTGGFLLALAVVIGTTSLMGEAAFNAWGWRIPFLFSLFLLAISLYIRLKLNESPVFQEMKAAGRRADNPVRESFASGPNVRLMLVALFGIAAGLTVIWFNAQFYTLYFLQGASRVSEGDARAIIAFGVVIAAPSFVFFGWLSDRLGRKKVICTGYLATLVLLFPIYWMMAGAANPEMVRAMEKAPVVVSMPDGCEYEPFAEVQGSDCARALEWLAASGIDYRKQPGDTFLIRIGERQAVQGFDADGLADALRAAGYPERSDPATRKLLPILLGVAVLGILSGATYGPVAATLVEMFPARIRYTSVSVPYHIGAGVFGGLLPAISQYIVVATGGVFAGLWYTWVIVAIALVVSLLFLPDRTGTDITG